MKKALILFLCFAMLAGVLLCGCAGDKPGAAPATDGAVTDALPESGTVPEASEEGASRRDPYASENVYEIDTEIFARKNGVDYGTVIADLSYPSTVAGDDKQCNVLLPAGYDESRTYPVMYVVHGFGDWHGDMVNERTYLVTLYGNMLARGLTVPMILVGLDMYTDPAAEKTGKTEAELKESYNKVIEEIHTDLMPFIEKSYPVSTEREDTAIAGISEGAGKALCIGFTWPGEFGWIGAFSPVAGVIPSEFQKDTFWNEPVMQAFPALSEEETPCYLCLAAGSDDPLSKEPTIYYRDALNECGIRNQTDLVEGYNHSTMFWRLCFYNFFAKVFQ